MSDGARTLVRRNVGVTAISGFAGWSFELERSVRLKSAPLRIGLGRGPPPNFFHIVPLTSPKLPIDSLRAPKAQPLAGRLRAGVQHRRALGCVAISGLDRHGCQLRAAFLPLRSAGKNF